MQRHAGCRCEQESENRPPHHRRWECSCGFQQEQDVGFAAGGGLVQGELHAALEPEVGLPGEAQPHGDLIGDVKADALDHVGETVGMQVSG